MRSSPKASARRLHLRIGRVLLASMTADGSPNTLFDVANQLNRGAALLIDHDEKVRVAAIDLKAGRKAKASAAYASARAYFSAGMGAVGRRDWSSQYEVDVQPVARMRGMRVPDRPLRRSRATDCESLLQRAVSKVDQAAVYHLRVQLHIIKSETQLAVATALTCLREFGIDLPRIRPRIKFRRNTRRSGKLLMGVRSRA